MPTRHELRNLGGRGKLYAWDEDSGARSEDGITCAAPDTVNHTLTCVIAHLTEFGVLGDANPTAVTLLDFRAVVQPDAVTLHWSTAAELDLQGFYLLRSATPAGPASLIGGSLIPAVDPGNLIGSAYTFVDIVSLAPGAAWYCWHDTVDFAGMAIRHGPLLAELPAGPDDAVQQIFLPAIMADAGSQRTPDAGAAPESLPAPPPDG